MDKMTIDGVVYYRSKWQANYTRLFMSENLSGKMLDMPALSTSCLENPYCIARMKNGENVCAQCFAAAIMERYQAASDHASENFHLLQDEIPGEELPELLPLVKVCRFESTGDLASVNQAGNYIRTAYKNPLCTFTIWTKNPNFLYLATLKYGKPANMIYTLSSLRVNRAESMERWQINGKPIFDKVFTVYSKEYLEAHNITSNCLCDKGSCRYKCGKCYDINNTETEIIETLRVQKKKRGGKK